MNPTCTRMRRFQICSLFAVLAAALILPLHAAPPTTAVEQTGAGAGVGAGGSVPSPDAALVVRGSQVAMFKDVHVPRGELRRGDVVSIFGNVTVEGEVTGDVVVIGGDLRLSGTAGHDVVAVLSSVSFGEGAQIEHDLVVVGAMEGNPRVQYGQSVHVPLFVGPIRWRTPLGWIGSLLAWTILLATLLLFLVLLLLSALAPDRVRILSDEVPASYFLAFLVGLGGYIGVLVAHLLLWITIIGIPVSGLLFLAFLVVKWLGVAGIYHYVGRSLGRLLGTELSLLPAILLGFLPFALLYLIPTLVGGFGFLLALAVRTLFWLLVEIPAVGLAILTRLGSRPRRPDAAWPAPPLPAAPLSPPPAPVP